ncbi:hypothetical protein HDU98_007736 [Podochytrium sp. JEL0797]|nr:hypothetical protein HDU98_007736 [Podochytrium sp. JEL0797]
MFPILLTHRSGVTFDLVRHLRSSMAQGQGPTKVHHIIKENYTLAHTEKCLEYLDVVETIARKQVGEEENSKLPDQLQPYYDAEVHRRAGHTSSGDHSFKFIKHLGKFEGERIAEGVYTDFNEYSEITLQQVTQTSTMEEIRESFVQDVRTRELLGMPDVKLRTSDRCCQDSSVYDEVYKLNRGVQTLLPLPIPEVKSFRVKTFEDTVAVIALLKPLTAHLDSSEDAELDLGLDTEWEVPKNGKLSTIQIAAKLPSGDYLYVIQLDPSLREFPLALKQLLEHPRVRMVGSYIHNEVKYLKEDWNVMLARRRSCSPKWCRDIWAARVGVGFRRLRSLTQKGWLRIGTEER